MGTILPCNADNPTSVFRVQRVTLCVCLWIPKFANNVAAIVEAEEMALSLHENARALRQIERLRRTSPALFLLQRNL